jgi:phosphoserine phosphatase
MSIHSLICACAVVAMAQVAAADPLPSWNDGDAKARIVTFVDAVSDPTSDSYITPADRIAVFDNDGTLWAEQPAYFQLIFAIDRLREMAAADPSILTNDTLKAAAEGDMDTLMAGGDAALIEVVNLTHSGVSVSDFQASVADWLASARHPDTGLGYDQMTYQPMIELLRYLRDEGFTTYIVSGGGVHFMRAFTQEAYGIPNRQIIGSLGETTYAVVQGVPTITKAPGIAFIDDKDTKPVAIDRIIGQRPIFAAGNSDGDFAMVEWVTAGDGPRFGMIVHHTDAAREYAYDRDSHIGNLNKGLDQGPGMGWLIVDMARDWARIYTGAH